MDVLTFLKIMVRRWYVLVPALIGVAVVTAGVASRIEPLYQSRGSMLLVPPPVPPPRSDVSPTPQEKNPYLQYDLKAVADILVRVPFGSDTARELKSGENDFTADSPAGARSPIVDVVTVARTPDAARQLRRTVLEGMKATLEERQRASGAPIDTWITADILDLPDQVTELVARKVRVLAAIALAGAGLAVSFTFAVDGILRRRSRRRRAERFPLDIATPIDPARRAAAGGPPRSLGSASEGQGALRARPPYLEPIDLDEPMTRPRRNGRRGHAAPPAPIPVSDPPLESEA